MAKPKALDDPEEFKGTFVPVDYYLSPEDLSRQVPDSTEPYALATDSYIHHLY